MKTTMQYVFETFHLIKAKIFRMPLLNLIYIIAIFIICTGYIDYREIYDDRIDSDNENGGPFIGPISVWWLLTFLSYPLVYFELKFNFLKRLGGFSMMVIFISMAIATYLSIYIVIWLTSGCNDIFWK